MAENIIELTQEGYDALEKEYRHLIDVERPQVIEEIAEARSQGDLSENADYDAARDKQAKIESRIKELEIQMHSAKIVTDDKSITLGWIITYAEIGLDGTKGAEKTVEMVGTTQVVSHLENAGKEGYVPAISDQCALGKVLKGGLPGKKYRVECTEPYDVVILEAHKKKIEQ